MGTRVRKAETEISACYLKRERFMTGRDKEIDRNTIEKEMTEAGKTWNELK